jgi:hypothetical protein
MPKIMKKIIYSLFIISLLFTNCIDKIDLKEPNISKKLIVDGTVTNLLGPYTVTLSFSVPFNSVKLTDLVNGANVSITDNLGNIYPLKDASNGVYRTDSAAFRGIVGRSYSLNIKVLDGREYKSKPELLLAPVPVDSVTSKYVPTQTQAKGFDVFVKVKDPSVFENFYRWKWRNYEAIDICQTSRAKSDAGSFVYLSPCCQPCWEITTSYGSLALFSDELINGKTFTQKVANIPYNGTYDYYMQIEQYSVSKENYNYWNLVQGQISNSGGIFDNTPAFIQGNVVNTKDPNEQVLGIFNVMGAVKKVAYIPRKVPGVPPVLPFPISGTIVTLRECLTCKGDGRTQVKPEGWK